MKKVYMAFSSDIIHSGHINIINRAAEYGEITAGVLTNEVVSSFDRYPITSLEERIKVLRNVKNIAHVVVQDSLSYDEILRDIKPDFVVHGDDWKTGTLSPVRDRVIEVLKEWGGELVEFPYTYSETLTELEKSMQQKLALPDVRRPRLKHLLGYNRPVRILEAHSGLSALIVENTKLQDGNEVRQFDGMWISSLCDSTIKGKPDIELVDMTSRLKTIDEVMEVTTKPIIFDGDTGGLTEHFVYNIRTLERVGVSAIIIEDKVGLKKNSLFGTQAQQQQDEIESFCEKISAGKAALQTHEFLIIARIESLILEQGLEDALTRAHAYVKAGADGVMIHSRQKEPDEIFSFCREFRRVDPKTPLVVVPTTFNRVTEEELYQHGVNVVIYANHLIRSAFPAMQKTAETILRSGRCLEADPLCMPIKEILTLIPER